MSRAKNVVRDILWADFDNQFKELVELVSHTKVAKGLVSMLKEHGWTVELAEVDRVRYKYRRGFREVEGSFNETPGGGALKPEFQYAPLLKAFCVLVEDTGIHPTVLFETLTELAGGDIQKSTAQEGVDNTIRYLESLREMQVTPTTDCAAQKAAMSSNRLEGAVWVVCRCPKCRVEC